MSRRDRDRLEDILSSIEAIEGHLTRGELDDGLVFDAVRVRLIEIGEAVRAVSGEVLAAEPDLPWAQIAGMRNRLAHQYFDTSHAIVAATVHEDLPELRAAVHGPPATRRVAGRAHGKRWHPARSQVGNRAAQPQPLRRAGRSIPGVLR